MRNKANWRVHRLATGGCRAKQSQRRVDSGQLAVASRRQPTTVQTKPICKEQAGGRRREAGDTCRRAVRNKAKLGKHRVSGRESTGHAGPFHDRTQPCQTKPICGGADATFLYGRGLVGMDAKEAMDGRSRINATAGKSRLWRDLFRSKSPVWAGKTRQRPSPRTPNLLQWPV